MILFQDGFAGAQGQQVAVGEDRVDWEMIRNVGEDRAQSWFAQARSEHHSCNCLPHG